MRCQAGCGAALPTADWRDGSRAEGRDLVSRRAPIRLKLRASHRLPTVAPPHFGGQQGTPAVPVLRSTVPKSRRGSCPIAGGPAHRYRRWRRGSRSWSRAGQKPRGAWGAQQDGAGYRSSDDAAAAEIPAFRRTQAGARSGAGQPAVSDAWEIRRVRPARQARADRAPAAQKTSYGRQRLQCADCRCRAQSPASRGASPVSTRMRMTPRAGGRLAAISLAQRISCKGRAARAGNQGSNRSALRHRGASAIAPVPRPWALAASSAAGLANLGKPSRGPVPDRAGFEVGLLSVPRQLCPASFSRCCPPW